MGRNNETMVTMQLKLTKKVEETLNMKLEFEKKLEKSNNIISKLTKELKEVRSKKSIVLEDDEIIKFMLEEKAKNKTVSMIRRDLALKYNIEYTSQDIQDRIGTIQDLSIDVQKFYYDKVKVNNNNRELIDEIERKNDLDRFNFLYDKLDSLLMSLEEDNPEHRQLIINTTDKMTQLMDRKNKINKDVIGDPNSKRVEHILNSMNNIDTLNEEVEFIIENEEFVN